MNGSMNWLPVLPADPCPSLTPSRSRVWRGGAQVRKATSRSLTSNQSALRPVVCRSGPASSLRIQHHRCSYSPPTQSIPVVRAGHPVLGPVEGFTSECSLSLSPSGLCRSSAPTEPPEAPTVEFYHRPFSTPVPLSPSDSPSLSQSLFLPAPPLLPRLC